MLKPLKNIAVLAHADAGKTSITEYFLYAGGRTRSLGSVDSGTAQSDFLDVEKTKGISVRSSYNSFDWKGITINLIDTPGHVDFSSEVERSLRVVDAAILVISAAEGVQAHTETIWRALEKKNIPVLIFINKIDRLGADIDQILEDINRNFEKSFVSLQKVIKEGSSESIIIPVWTKDQLSSNVLEILSEFDESIFEKYVENKKISFSEADSSLKNKIQNADIIPILFGSAKYSVGLDELLDAIVHYFPNTENDFESDLSALIFAISYDKKLGKIAFTKVLKGKIGIRDSIKNISENLEEKVIQIKKIESGSYSDKDIAYAGDIVGLIGLTHAKAGQIIGSESKTISEEVILNSPLITVQIKPENDKDFSALKDALEKLYDEDPSLGFDTESEERELHLSIMGWMQMEIIESILETRFSVKAKFQDPTIIYKETPSKSGFGFVQYWMPKPCWAILKFKIEPGERGSGVIYRSEISVDDVHQKYQNEVERTIPDALKQGIKGWEVTDIVITLVEGEDHQIHSRPGDFVVATPMGIMQGLKEVGTTLLEPIVSFKIKAPEELLGKIASDITQMRGVFDSPEIENEKFILKGSMPLATSVNYPVKLSSRSGGKAQISTKFRSYEDCEDDQGIIREYKGISPLDTSKYILKARKAL